LSGLAGRAPAARRLQLVTRADCGLCEELQGELEALRAQHELPPVELVDVDSDPLLQRRWGLKVPVLLLDGAKACEGRLDGAELLRLLRL
jgi:hypothetical protein